MELKKCSHFHYISTIKNGSVMKIPNVTRGISSGFQIRDIHQRLKSDCIGGDDGQNSNIEDPSFGDMTLKEMKEKCKPKKRKLSSHIDSSTETVETCSTIKLECFDDEDDLIKPLSSWKSELSKNKKRKKQVTKNLASYQSPSVAVKSEQVSSDEELLQSTEYMPNHSGIKLEVNFCAYQNMSSRKSGTEELYSGRGLSSDEPEISTDPAVETGSFRGPTNESQCSVHEVPYEASLCDSQDMIHDASEFSLRCCTEELYTSGGLSSNDHKISTDPVLETDCFRTPTNESQCFVREHSYEYQELTPPRTSGLEIVRLDSTEVVSHEFLGSEDEDTEYITHAHPLDIDLTAILPPWEYSSEIQNDFQSDSSLITWPFQTISVYPLCSSTSDDSLLCLEYTKNECLHTEETSLVSESKKSCNSDSCSCPESCLASVPYDPPNVEDKQSQLSSCADMICYSADYPEDHFDKQTVLSGAEDQHIKPQLPPARLFSTRKFQAISPTSQQRLCKAVESMALHGNRPEECKSKVYFEKPGQIRREANTIQKQFIKKVKCEVNPRDKGIPKGSHHFPAGESLSPGCFSGQSCSQKAINFSQRQLRDAQSLADELTKELNFMKDIVRESIYFGANSAAALRQNMEKVQTAIENATKAEDSVKRHLYSMAKDRNRFCKVMELSVDDSAVSKNIAPKGKRKITFADEAGKKLCHVKIIDDDAASATEPSGGKQGSVC